jgi:hypothetical protein
MDGVVRTRADEDSVAVDGRSSQRLMVKGHGRTENGGCLFFPLRSFHLDKQLERSSRSSVRCSLGHFTLTLTCVSMSRVSVSRCSWMVLKSKLKSIEQGRVGESKGQMQTRKQFGSMSE